MNFGMTNQTKQEQSSRIVHTAYECVAGETVRYRLLEREGRFTLRMVYLLDEVELSLGKDFARAAVLFEALRKGSVTPCTAKDVLEDLFLIVGE